MDNHHHIQLEHVLCDFCGSDDTVELYSMPDLRYWTSDQVYTVVKCRGCGHRYLNPRPIEADFAKCYPPRYYEGRERVNSSQNDRYKRQARYFDGHEKGRFLDIGCAGGAFLEVMRNLGWECFGVDVCEPADSENLPKGINFDFGSLETMEYPDAHFDAISAWGVFEHVYSPKTYFREVGRILKPGGSAVILVTNARSLWSRAAYKEDIPRHIHFFTAQTVQQYADISSLRIAGVEYTNNIYSRPASGSDVFRINMLRALGVPWRSVNGKQETSVLRLVSRFGSAMGKLLIHPCMEEMLGMSGIMVVRMTTKSP